MKISADTPLKEAQAHPESCYICRKMRCVILLRLMSVDRVARENFAVVDLSN